MNSLTPFQIIDYLTFENSRLSWFQILSSGEPQVCRVDINRRIYTLGARDVGFVPNAAAAAAAAMISMAFVFLLPNCKIIFKCNISCYSFRLGTHQIVYFFCIIICSTCFWNHELIVHCPIW